MHKKKWNKVKLGVEKKDKKSNIKLKIYIALGIVCVIFVLYFIRLPEYRIKDTVIKEAILTKESDIIDIVKNYLSSNYLFVIPKSNIWLFPKKGIANSIKQLPSIENVNIDLGRDNILYITVKERGHEFVWCDDSNKCFYMNKDGYIFAPSPNFEGNLFITFRGLVVGDPLGQSILDKNTMSSLIDFVNELKGLKINVVVIDIVTVNEVNLILDNNSKIIVSIDKDLKQTLKSIKTLVESKDFIKESGGIESVEYIDLRYNKKAFWK